MNTLDYILKKFNVTPEPLVRLPYMRAALSTIFKELGFKSGAEIGIDKGGFANEIICTENPDLKMYGIDPWASYEGYNEKRMSDQHELDRRYEKSRRRLSTYPNCELIKDFSMNAVKKFPPNSLDFVYIDANHDYKYVLEDIEAWAKVVKPGGIVSGHDYKSISGALPEVGMAVDDYVKTNNIKTLFTFVENNDSSWFFVK